MAAEKRLIDACALIKYISERTAVTYPNLFPGLFKAIGYIRTFPTVDAVEVVRCKDCSWYEKRCDFCTYWDGVRHPEHYCGEGEVENATD